MAERRKLPVLDYARPRRPLERLPLEQWMHDAKIRRRRWRIVRIAFAAIVIVYFISEAIGFG